VGVVEHTHTIVYIITYYIYIIYVCEGECVCAQRGLPERV